jgi:glycosyltransferase involved in cell wall biosynthesis
MKVLFTTPILEHPPAGGPQLRIANSIKALSRVSELHVINRAPLHGRSGRDTLNHFSQHCQSCTIAPSAAGLSERRIVRALQGIIRKASSQSRDARFLTDYALNHDIGILWFGYGNISFPLIRQIKTARPDLRVVCDTDSVWSRFILREIPFITNRNRRRTIEKQGREKEREERAWVNLCDITTAVSEVDAQYYRELAGEPDRIRLFSNVIDLSSYENVPPPPEDLNKPAMFLAGSFGYDHSPMEMAARWVLEEVLPRVRKRIPAIHFYIVGRDSDITFRNLKDPKVTVTGRLHSVLPYLCHADVALVPLKFESGTRFKIMEAGACGIPIVSTTLGAEGLPVTDGRDIWLADEPEPFADGIIRLIEDRIFAGKLADNCRTLIRERCSIESLEAQAMDILRRLAP